MALQRAWERESMDVRKRFHQPFFAYSFNAKLYTLSQGGGEKYPYKVDNYVLTQHSRITPNLLIHRDIKSKIKLKLQFSHCTPGEVKRGTIGNEETKPTVNFHLYKETSQ